MKDRDVSLGSLRVLMAVAEAATLTAAARNLGVTQSAVSQAIAHLEELSGATLIVRHARPVRLTPAGEAMRSHAEKILSRSHRMLQDVSRAATGELPRLAIGVIDSFGHVTGSGLVDRLAGVAPQLSLQTGLVMPMTEALLAGDLDMLLSSDPMEDHPQLESHPVARDPFVLVVSKGHCKAAQVDIRALAESAPFVRYSHRLRLGKLSDLVLRRLDVSVESRYEFDSTQALLDTVRACEGWGIATALCLAADPVMLRGLRTLPLADNSNARYLCLAARRGELAEAPSRVAGICRELFTEQALPKALRLMPWLEGHAMAITEAPILWTA